MATTANSFPPCTAGSCNVEEEEEQDKKIKKADGSLKPSCKMKGKCVNSCAAYGKVCPLMAQIASHSACDAVKKLKENSRVFVSDQPDFTYLDADDIVIGEKIGEGGFSNVNSVLVKVGDDAGKEFAVKYLKRRAMVDLHHFKHGAADLAVEAYFLQTLNHPNIVKLHGMTAGSVETNVASGKECGFFIVVDRLFDTLETRIDKWGDEQMRGSAGFLARLSLSSDFRQRKKKELMDRVRIAYGIANAMEYLHSLNIVYRDLKPDNIGFDADGVLKLFDFGLAKELKQEDEKDDGTYALTGNTGSKRYMAPEVALEYPYNKSVDIYSFGILLWELCSTEKPFYGYSSAKHMKQVVLAGERPKMDTQHTLYWPLNLQWLMARCWSSKPSLRPTFTVVKQVLRDVLNSKEQVPLVLLDSEEETPAEDPPVLGFGSCFNPQAKTSCFRPQWSRSKTMSKISPPVEGFKSIKPTSRTRRSRTWGFGFRR